MEKWWFYEVANAQAAYDAVLELILNYSRDELTGLGAVSREGRTTAIICTSTPAARIRPGRSTALRTCWTSMGAGRTSPGASSSTRTVFSSTAAEMD